MKYKKIKDSQVIMHELVLPNDTNVLDNVHGFISSKNPGMWSNWNGSHESLNKERFKMG